MLWRIYCALNDEEKEIDQFMPIFANSGGISMDSALLIHVLRLELDGISMVMDLVALTLFSLLLRTRNLKAALNGIDKVLLW